MGDRSYRIRIFGAMFISLVLVLLFGGEIKINNSWAWFNRITEPLKKISSLKVGNGNILTNTDSQNSFKMSASNNIELTQIAPTETPIPLTPTIIPTTNPLIPTGYVYPTYVTPTGRYVSPTKKPTPTSLPPSPTPKKIGELPLRDPLSQPYYGAASSICYQPEYIMKYYVGNITPNACYSNIEAIMKANLVSVTLLGRSISVHKRAAPYFQAVADELAVYQQDDGTFKFPSKTYKIKDIWAYNFSCNTAQNKSNNCYDPCSEGWVIGDHAFGIAVDINASENCVGCKNYTMPKEIVNAFERWGFRWGGRYDMPIFGNATIDPMHFEYLYDVCKGL